MTRGWMPKGRLPKGLLLLGLGMGGLALAVFVRAHVGFAYTCRADFVVEYCPSVCGAAADEDWMRHVAGQKIERALREWSSTAFRDGLADRCRGVVGAEAADATAEAVRGLCVFMVEPPKTNYAATCRLTLAGSCREAVQGAADLALAAFGEAVADASRVAVYKATDDLQQERARRMRRIDDLKRTASGDGASGESSDALLREERAVVELDERIAAIGEKVLALNRSSITHIVRSPVERRLRWRGVRQH